MADYMLFVDWVVTSVTRFWNFWMSQHFIFRALLLSPFLVIVVGLIHSTFHSDV